MPYIFRFFTFFNFSATINCIDNPPYPVYGSEIKTLILIVEVQSSKLITNALKNSIDDLSLGSVKSLYKQYILGYYYYSQTTCRDFGWIYAIFLVKMEFQTKVFTEHEKFKEAIAGLTNVSVSPTSASSAEEVLKLALSLAVRLQCRLKSSK